MCARDSNITVGYPYFFLSCIDTLVLVEVVKKKKKDIKVRQKAASNCTLNVYISFV